MWSRDEKAGKAFLTVMFQRVKMENNEYNTSGTFHMDKLQGVRGMNNDTKGIFFKQWLIAFG